MLLVLLCLSGQVLAQHEADTWYFGNQVGFSFRTGSPMPLLDGQLTTTYACAVASNPESGQLLFYSNSVQVWNRAHHVMPTGDSLRGTTLTNQGALIVPVPGNDQRYYLFTLWQPVQPGPVLNTGGASHLFYSVVDMSLDGGQGDVIVATKNTLLAAHLTQKLTAIRHTNGKDYWVLSHIWGSNRFLVYAVTSQGIRLAHDQAIGAAQPSRLADTLRIEGTAGYLQASPNGRRIACAVAFGQEPFSLFNFDPTTGLLSHYLNLGLLQDGYGVCFSPDNTKLYVGNATRLANRAGYAVVSQYDLVAGSDTAIVASGQSIVAGNPNTMVSTTHSDAVFYALQNAPDGRIYGASAYRDDVLLPFDSGLQTLFILNQPNARGYACGLVAQRFAAFGTRSVYGGLPNFMQHTFADRVPIDSTSCDPKTATVFPNPTTEEFRVQVAGNCHQPYVLTLYNAVGQRVLFVARSGSVTEGAINIAFLAAGLYVVELRFAQQTAYKKLVKY